MESRPSKLGPNTGKKLGPNTGPKLGPNTGPKLGPNTGPKLGLRKTQGVTCTSVQNTRPNWRIGVGGIPIGRGIHGTQPKIEIPSNLFRNTGNNERVGNTERQGNLELAANTEKTSTFKSNNDILELLKNHPNFERVPPDALQPIVAAILSGLLIGGGVTVLLLPAAAIGSSTAVALKITGSALMAGGIGGFENAWREGASGSFTWSNWSADAAISASTVVLTMGSASIAAWGTTGYMMLNANKFTVESLLYISRCSTIASTLVGGLASSAGEALKKVIKQDEINPCMLLICLVTGALQGYKIGPDVSDCAIRTKLRTLASNADDMCAFYSKFWTTTENFWTHVDKHAMQIEVGEFSADQMLGLASFDPEHAQGVTILSRDSLQWLRRLDPHDRALAADYGWAAKGVAENPQSLAYQVKTRVFWNRWYYDSNTKMFLCTSIHNTDPINHPDKIVTCYKMAVKKFDTKVRKMFELFDQGKAQIADF